MIKRFLLILVLIFSLQSWTKAEDISDISIEGISIGDSALDFFSEEDIKNNSKNFYKNNKYVPVQMEGYSFFEKYDAIDFDYKINDKKYIIHGLYGVLFIKDIDKCEAQLDKIINDITPMLTNTFEIEKSKIIHDVDPSGKSYIIEKQWLFPNGDRILVQCYNFAETLAFENSLSLSIRTKEYHNFLRKIAYKTIT